MQMELNQIGQSILEYAPNLIGAIAILIIGWILASIISRIVRGVLKRTSMGKRMAGWLGKQEMTTGTTVEDRIAKGVFWIIMILVFVALFQVLGLTFAIEPLNGLLVQVFAFIPRFVAAGILLLIAWLIATVLRLIITKVLGATGLDARIGGEPEEDTKQVPLSKTLGEAVYWLVFLLFLPAVLGALNLVGLLQPVQNMIDKLLNFFPNLLAATIILLVGWLVARIVQRIVSNLLAAIGADRLSDRIGLASSLGSQKLSGVLGLVVYVFIFIPVLVAALNALSLDAVTQPASSMLSMILEALPTIFTAALIIVLAYVIGKVVAGLVAKLLAGIGFNGLLGKLGFGDKPAEGKWMLSNMVGTLVLVAILLFATIEASKLLGFAVIGDLVTQFTVFASQILLGLIIFAFGLYVANLVAKAIRASKTSHAGSMAVAARVAILILISAIALRKMGLANEIINLGFSLLLGAVAVAVAIAFGIGGREIAGQKLKEWTKSQ